MDKITWQALEFVHHDKSAGWFVALWIIAGGLIVVAVITKSLFIGILVLVGALVISLFAAKKPRTLNFSLDGSELNIEEKPYPLDDFSSFWVQETENASTLLLNPKKLTRPMIKVMLLENQVSDIRLILRPVLEEQEQEESLTDAMADWLKF